MHNLAGFFDLVILLGAVQGFIITALLYSSKGTRLPNRLLGALIFLISLACLTVYLSAQHWFNSSNGWQIAAAIVPTIVVMPMGPLVLFYTRASLDADFKLGKKERLQFYLVVIDFFPNILVVLTIVGLVTHVIKAHHFSLGVFIDNYNVYADIPRWLSLSFYLLLTRRYLAKGTAQGQAQVLHQSKWFGQCITVLMIFQLIWLIYLIPYVIPQVTDRLLQTVAWYPVYVPLAILVYWLSIKGYLAMKYQQFMVKRNRNIRSVLPEYLLDETVLKLKTAMEIDALYLNPELNLQMLADGTGIPPKTISAVINRHFKKSFNEFVNEYRIRAFKEKMQQPEMHNFTFAGIASKCGFSSQATFQRSFKQVTGLSPSEFKNQLP